MSWEVGACFLPIFGLPNWCWWVRGWCRNNCEGRWCVRSDFPLSSTCAWMPSWGFPCSVLHPIFCTIVQLKGLESFWFWNMEQGARNCAYLLSSWSFQPGFGKVNTRCQDFPLSSMIRFPFGYCLAKSFPKQNIPTQTQEEQFTILTDFHKTGSHLMYQYIWFCRRSAIYDIPNHSKGVQCLCSLNIVSPKSSRVFVEYGEISTLFKRD